MKRLGLTRRQSIRWLKKQPQDSVFHYANGVNGNPNCGCLFTTIMRAVHKNDSLLVGSGGDVVANGNKNWQRRNIVGQVKFHDTFWRKFWRKATKTNEPRISCSRDEAIATLSKKLC